MFLVLMAGFVSANELDYNIISLSKGDQGDYANKQSNFNFQIGMTDGSVCRYECEYYNSINPSDRTSFTLDSDHPNEVGSFPVDLVTNQNQISGTFHVSCTRKGFLCIADTTLRQEEFSTDPYGYNGDGTCQPEESCNSAIDDCGKCDGVSCNKNSECEGGYCVNGICSSKSYIEGDGICNSGEGETCKNSVVDCGCDSNERCSQNAICETYCGNGICEQQEAGICKADCTWCGDGVCNANENCNACSLDCGECKKEDKPSPISAGLDSVANKETQENKNEVKSGVSKITGNVVSNNSESTENSSIKNIILITIGLLVLLVFIYSGRKYLSNKKNINPSDE